MRNVHPAYAQATDIACHRQVSKCAIPGHDPVNRHVVHKGTDAVGRSARHRCASQRGKRQCVDPARVRVRSDRARDRGCRPPAVTVDCDLSTHQRARVVIHGDREIAHRDGRSRAARDRRIGLRENRDGVEVKLHGVCRNRLALDHADSDVARLDCADEIRIRGPHNIVDRAPFGLADVDAKRVIGQPHDLRHAFAVGIVHAPAGRADVYAIERVVNLDRANRAFPRVAVHGHCGFPRSMRKDGFQSAIAPNAGVCVSRPVKRPVLAAIGNHAPPEAVTGGILGRQAILDRLIVATCPIVALGREAEHHDARMHPPALIQRNSLAVHAVSGQVAQIAVAAIGQVKADRPGVLRVWTPPRTSDLQHPDDRRGSCPSNPMHDRACGQRLVDRLNGGKRVCVHHPLDRDKLAACLIYRVMSNVDRVRAGQQHFVTCDKPVRPGRVDRDCFHLESVGRDCQAGNRHSRDRPGKTQQATRHGDRHVAEIQHRVIGNDRQAAADSVHPVTAIDRIRPEPNRAPFHSPEHCSQGRAVICHAVPGCAELLWGHIVPQAHKPHAARSCVTQVKRGVSGPDDAIGQAKRPQQHNIP